ncbi:MAG: HAD-IIA family hydrolase [Capsulimonadales bacterium]|nr:HAD-IIA family hydrolase [Capsulimonadales bacterium]
MSFSTRVFIFDLDGVLYRGETAVPHAAEALSALRQRTPAVRLFFLTNNSTQPRRVFAEKMARLGMPATEDEIVTSASATALYIASQGDAGKTALVVGGDGIIDELTRIGMTVRSAGEPEVSGERIDYVVVGLDRSFRYEALFRAQQAILNGAVFLATNRDGQYPVEGGLIPGAGAMVAAIEACADVRPIVIGKPETLGLRMILDMAGATPPEAVMIGDRLDTDIACGNRLGMPTVLVLTGVTTPERVLDTSLLPAEMRPGRILTDLSLL